MKKIATGILCAVAAMATMAFSVSNGPVYPGEWNGSFTKGKNYAEMNHVPMLLLWARATCPMCNAMKASMDGAYFAQWAAEHRIVMSLCHDTDSDSKAALSFIRQGGMFSDLPLFSIYWQRADGTVVLRSFVGRDRTMPAKSGSLAEQLTASIEQVLGEAGYDFGSTADAPHPPPVVERLAPSVSGGAGEWSVVQYLPTEREYALENLEGGMVKVKKASGKIPPGMKMFYDASVQAIRFSGLPSKSGSFVSQWAVSERRGTSWVAGKPFNLMIRVDPVSSVAPAFVAKSLKANGYIASDSGDLEGVVSVTLSQKGQAKIKFEDANGLKENASSSGWMVEWEPGQPLVTEGSGKNVNFALTAERDGTLGGTLLGADGVLRRIIFSQTIWSANSSAQAYTLDREVAFGDGLGSIRLTMNAGGAKTGRFSFKSVLNDRMRFSGSGFVVETERGTFAQFPVLKKSGKASLAGVLGLDARTGAVAGKLVETDKDGNKRVLEIQ